MRTPAVTIGLLIVLALVAAPATAHKTAYTPNGKIKFVYGNLNEPVYTFQKTGIDLGIFDNATGAPIPGLESVDHAGNVNPKLNVSLTYSGQTLWMTDGWKAQFGKAGWYTYPITYTRPGLYAIHIKGMINGTDVDQTIPNQHAIESQDAIMWPEKVPAQTDQEAKIKDLTAQVDQLKTRLAAVESDGSKAKSPGFDAIFMLLALAGLAALVMRQRR